MSISRISTNYAFIRSLRNISESFIRLNELQEKLNTGKEIIRPSDDPVGMQKVFALGTSIKENERFQENIDYGIGRLNAASSTLGQIEEILLDIIEVSTGAGSTIATSAERGAMAQEVEILLDHLVNLANSAHQGKFLFGGLNFITGGCPLGMPFNVVLGADGFISGVLPTPRGINTLVFTNILPGIRDSVNISGAAPFQPNGQGQMGDVFNVLVNFRRNLENSDVAALQTSQQEIKDALTTVITQDSFVGSKINKLEIAKDTLNVMTTNEKEAKSRIEDADYARLLIEFSQAEILFNTTLATTSTLLKNSLINFI